MVQRRKAGVKAGDVITAIDGEAVDSPGEISRVINRKKEGEVTLTIIRNKSQQTIRVTPKEGGGFSGTISQPELGRRIVIPRIEIPDAGDRHRNAANRDSGNSVGQHQPAAHARDAASPDRQNWARADLINTGRGAEQEQEQMAGAGGR